MPSNEEYCDKNIYMLNYMTLSAGPVQPLCNPPMCKSFKIAKLPGFLVCRLGLSRSRDVVHLSVLVRALVTSRIVEMYSWARQAICALTI